MNSQCAICLLDMNANNGEIIDSLNCGHSFHCDCIHPWLDVSDTCPSCRRSGVKELLMEPPFDESMYVPLQLQWEPKSQRVIRRRRKLTTRTGRVIFFGQK